MKRRIKELRIRENNEQEREQNNLNIKVGGYTAIAIHNADQIRGTRQ